MKDSIDPHGLRLPIKLDSTSNGEFQPIPLSPVHHYANRLAQEQADQNARRLGLDRRKFLVSACGAASTLLAFNSAYGANNNRGGWFDLPRDAAVDNEIAAGALNGHEFIFDIQGHFVNPNGSWLQERSPRSRPFDSFEKSACPLADEPGDLSYLRCLGPDEFIKDVFMDSDTDIMVLSFVPSRRETEPLTIEEANATREIIGQMAGNKRLLLHGRVNPNQEGDVDDMAELVERYRVSAFKTYTQWGPSGDGYFLSDDVGLAFIERARDLGVPNICVHKGIPFGKRSYQHSLCDDIGVVARRYPDMNFIVYHSGYVPDQDEGPYDPNRNEGIDSLVKTVLDNQIAPNSNVYAELGSTWRRLMQNPTSAAHALGKLFTHVGENNVLWGTDSIWYGSPQDQIQAFRAFQISEALRAEYGYPEITHTLREKVFGLNAAKPYGLDLAGLQSATQSDKLASKRLAYREQPRPNFRTYGPRTRREFLNLHSSG